MKRAAVVLGVAVLCTLAARLAAPSLATQPGGPYTPGALCGVERWTVKTLQDRPTLLRRQNTTVAHLIALPKPAHLPATRLPFERRVFRVIGAVTLVRQEADQDLHIVISRGPAHMIVEAPNAPTCTPNATAYRKRQMIAARKAVLQGPPKGCARAQITGVAFFDFLHGQTGVAPNGIELHPVLGFSCLPGTPPPGRGTE